MKTIFRVAKAELRTLFYSPIAWFLIIIFFIQCGAAYISLLKNVARIQEYGGLQVEYLRMVTTRIFLNSSGVFRNVMENLYLYLPLITMGLISRETGSGTIKLLYSSPIKIRDIVLGKFLAMMIFSLILLAVIAVYAVSGCYHIQNAETGMLLTGLLGFYLLLCAYSAIGLFMSTLTTYQVVAALSTFVMIGVLAYIGRLWQRVELVRELTYFLSMPGRTFNMLQGLVSTKDVIYFILIVILFLGFSVYKLKGGMESKPWTVKAMRYGGVVAVVLLLGYITSIPSIVGYYDATRGKTNTITPVVQQIVKEMADAPLEITSYANLLDETYMLDHPDAYNEVMERWAPYLRYNNNMKFNKISYYDSALNNPDLFRQYPGKKLVEIADLNAKRFDMELDEYLKPAEIRKIIDLRPELNRYVMQVKWKDQKAFLRVFDESDGWPSGTEIAVVLKRLQKERMPKIAFITGEMERDIIKKGLHTYSSLVNSIGIRNSLINQGFDVVTVDLSIQDIPAGIDALVLADPKLELHPATKEKLTAFINKGGNMLIAGEPGKQAMMNPILKPLGVQIAEGLLIEESDFNPPDDNWQVLTPFAASFYHFLEKAKKANAGITINHGTALTWSDTGSFVVKPLLRTMPQTTWRRIKPFDPETMDAAKVDTTKGRVDTANHKKYLGMITYSPQDGDVKDTMSSVISLSRKINNKEQRIVVCADADFISNVVLSNNAANLYFSTGVFSWLTGGKFPVDSSRPDAIDNRVTVNIKQINRLRIIYIWIVPALLLMLGTAILIRRKRK